jgi:hypothetical protein
MDKEFNDTAAVDDGDLNKEFSDLDPAAAKMLQEGTLDAPEQAQAVKDDEEDESYSKKVKKRIGREVYKTKTALTRAEVAEQELRKKNALIAKMQKEHNELMSARLTEEIELHKATAAKALDDSDTEVYMTANDKMLDAKVKLARLAEEKFDEVEEEAAPAAPAKTQAVDHSDLAPAAQNWIDENDDWISTDPAKFKRAQQLASKLEAEGYDPTDPALYEELDAQLNQKPAQSIARQPAAHVNVPGNNTPVAPAAMNNRLTPEDLRNMVTYGLNPQKASDRAHWLAGKQGV